MDINGYCEAKLLGNRDNKMGEVINEDNLSG